MYQSSTNIRLDIQDGADSTIAATFELPELRKEDVNIQLHKNRLTVSGQTNISVEREDGGYAVRERSFGSFERSLRLPEGVKDEDIKANIQDGLLTITFPKVSAEQAPKRITVL